MDIDTVKAVAAFAKMTDLKAVVLRLTLMFGRNRADADVRRLEAAVAGKENEWKG